MYRMLLEAVFELPGEALGLEPNEPDAAGPIVPVRTGGQDVAPAVLSYFARQRDEHARLDNLAGPRFVLATASTQLRQIEKLAENGAPEVARLAARYAEFTGWLHQDAGELTEAMRLTNQAVDLAEACGDEELTTYNLMRKANVLTATGNRQAAASTARRALTAATDRFPSLIPVCLRQQALAAARLGDVTTSREAIDRALALADRNVTTGRRYSAYCTTSYVRMEAALCLLSLREPKAAEQVCAEVLDDWPAELPRDRVLCLARRGVALVELREVEEACRTALLAVDGVRSAPSGRAIHMLRVIATRLRPFGRNPHVRELTAALAEVA